MTYEKTESKNSNEQRERGMNKFIKIISVIMVLMLITGCAGNAADKGAQNSQEADASDNTEMADTKELVEDADTETVDTAESAKATDAADTTESAEATDTVESAEATDTSDAADVVGWINKPIDRTPKYKDVEYGNAPTVSGEDRILKMNIYQADNVKEQSPVVVFIHGGAWWEASYECEEEFTGEWDNQQLVYILSLVDEGVTVATIDYRLSQEAPYPAQIMDCKAAVRFLRANAQKYGIDPDKIASAGTSAGAHLALLLAVTGDVKELEGDIGGNTDQSSRVQACVDFYGMTDILNLSTDLYNAPYNISGIDAYNQVDAFDSARSQLIGFNKEGQGIGVLRAEEYNPDTPYKEYLDLVKLASPIYFVTTDDPPIYMANGGKDHRVSVAQPERLNKLYTQAGLESYMVINSVAGHGNLGTYINEGALSFLRDKLNITN